MTVARDSAGPGDARTRGADRARPYGDAVPADPQAAAALRDLEEADRTGSDPPPDHPLVPETRPLPVAPVALPSVDDLVRIATDSEPDAAVQAADLVLGPLADHADPDTLRMAVAWGASTPTDGSDAVPLARVCKDKGLPRAQREALNAVLRAPPSAWRIVATDGHHATLEDLVGLGAAAPDGPVRWRTPATPFGAAFGATSGAAFGATSGAASAAFGPASGTRPGTGPGTVAGTAFGPVQAGGIVLTAIARGPDGWEMVAPIVVPPSPELQAALPRWLPWIARAARVVDPRARTMADVLRARGASLARRIVGRLWAEHA